MTLRQARKLRDFLRGHNIRCTAPVGCADGEYFVRAKMYDGIYLFTTMQSYKDYVAKRRKQLADFCQKNGIGVDRRSPIERMIDEATRYKP